MEKQGIKAQDSARAGLRLRALLQTGEGPVAIVPAAGTGSRAGLPLPKQYQRIGSDTVLAHAVKALAGLESLRAIVVILSPEDTGWEQAGLEQALSGLPHVLALSIGGPTRRQSVLAGCRWLASTMDPSANPWIMVHDAARPFVGLDALTRLWQSHQRLNAPMHGSILAAPVLDTMKRANASAKGQSNSTAGVRVGETLDRSLLWAAQTPQMFRLADLICAYEACVDATDEAAAIEASGGTVELIASERTNFKLTEPEDFKTMEKLMNPDGHRADRAGAIAIGQGFDVHALVAGRPLIIGGVSIPFDKGLQGHSDADVLLHAITDAVLGAAAMGDIGRMFPDTDMAYRDADSAKLLAAAVARVREAGWQVSQIDATVIAQAPKIAPYAAQMQAVIAQACAMPAARVNVKGKTTEGLGFTGRGEGIAAQAVAMLARSAA